MSKTDLILSGILRDEEYIYLAQRRFLKGHQKGYERDFS